MRSLIPVVSNLLFCSLLAIAASSCLAGPLGHSVEGTILDPSRTPIANAVITASPESGESVSTYSGRSGEFAFDLRAGNYLLRISAEGFQELQQTVTVTGNATARVQIVMSLAEHQQVVTVTESANYQVLTSQSTKAPTPLQDIPQSISVVTQELIRDQAMQNMADVVRYVPGITMAQGEGHRDAPVIRGNATTADFYVNGVRDDVQYYRDLYNVESVEAVKGANALTFGRGGGGGVINRVTKQAQFFPIREVSLQGGSFSNKRITSDFSQGLNDRIAVRLNGVYENSGSFRDEVDLERYGISPTLSIKAGESTFIRLGYEYFHDGRTVDRGIPSYNGGPSASPRTTFFGNPDESYADAGVNLGTAAIEHQLGKFNLRNSTLIGDYDKFYQNVFPGAVNAGQTLVGLSGYNNSTLRRNLFNQTDVTGFVHTGALRHTLLAGTEVGRQRSDNFRATAYFNDTATSIQVPFANPTFRGPVTFRQSASDADNNAINKVAAVYVQDQIELTRYLQVVAGVRYDYFDIDFHDNPSTQELSRQDHMVSPRAGLVLKPFSPLSVYTSYSVSYLPSAGDQFSSLTATTQTLKPEKFTNYEVGTKWNVNRSFALTTALYRLDRVNTTARDPNDPARIVQTGSQRTNGFELGINGNLTNRWSVVGGYAYQDAFISSPTTAAVMGAKVALVPNHSLSLWNNYRILPRWGMGLGIIHQAEMFAGVDNTVRLPEFTRADVATYFTLSEMVRLQANVENLLDRTYYGTAHSNNNIMPGYARAVRIGLIARF
jgi:catecholate siderophore receptor